VRSLCVMQERWLGGNGLGTHYTLSQHTTTTTTTTNKHYITTTTGYSYQSTITGSTTQYYSTSTTQSKPQHHYYHNSKQLTTCNDNLHKHLHLPSTSSTYNNYYNAAGLDFSNHTTYVNPYTTPSPTYK
jgi:hypothetical protein